MAVKKNQTDKAVLNEDEKVEDLAGTGAEEANEEVKGTEDGKDAAGPPPRDYGRKEEMVEIELFYDGEKYSEPLFVGVNGKSYLIKRGEPVMVPKSVAEVIRNSNNQLRYLNEIQKKLENVEYKNMDQ